VNPQENDGDERTREVGQRPIGIPTLEDKIVQRATVKVLSAVYETDFLGFSDGALHALGRTR
jgi:retron-type reverse transcriptase